MQCDRCQASIPDGEQREHLGRILCEDCYMDVLSPAKTCDPWAVHSAKSFEREHAGHIELTPVQERILGVLKETGGLPAEELPARVNLKAGDLEREIAALRHMEKVRAELRNGRKYITLW